VVPLLLLLPPLLLQEVPAEAGEPTQPDALHHLLLHQHRQLHFHLQMKKLATVLLLLLLLLDRTHAAAGLHLLLLLRRRL
jgi:hypothetical protein